MHDYATKFQMSGSTCTYLHHNIYYRISLKSDREQKPRKHVLLNTADSAQVHLPGSGGFWPLLEELDCMALGIGFFVSMVSIFNDIFLR